MAETIYKQRSKEQESVSPVVGRRSGIVLKDNRVSAINQLKASNTGLPEQLKSGIEHLSGMSMDHVRVHYNSSKPAQLNALAYAQGSNIHVAPGQEKHLPHEAWHVVQQAQGRVRPTMQAKGVAINDDKGLEREADVMGGKTLSVGTRLVQRIDGDQGGKKGRMQSSPLVNQLAGYCHNNECEKYNKYESDEDDYCKYCGGNHFENQLGGGGEVEKQEEVEEEEEEEKEEEVVEKPLPKPPMYQIVKEGWEDKEAVFSHCYTYCQGTQIELVQAAEALELPPPMLGHGSQMGKGGTAKDAKLYENFKKYMEYIFQQKGIKGRSISACAKKVLKK